MKPAAMLTIGILLLTLLGCGPASNSLVMECTAPLIPKGDGCCMDADKNGVCDVDEAVAAKETKPAEQAEPAEEVKAEEETQAKDTTTAKETEAAAPKPTQEGAEKTGKTFVDRWQLKQYNTMYALFTDDLKQQKTATEFSAIMELDPFYKKITKVEFIAASMVDEDTAELSIVAHTNTQKIDIPGATLEFRDGEWKVNVFADVFTLSLFDAACSGYRYNNQYKTSDCAFDLAKKVKDAQYCNVSECHYVECLRAMGKTATYMQEAQQCFYCQPVGKTTNQCILDVAIKSDKLSACNVIPDSKYADKYCVCYGGFAKSKGTAGYCNTIQDANYKDQCEKGFSGGFC